MVKNEVLFDFNSAGLRPASRDSLSEMAKVFEKYDKTTIAVEGHTDSIGSAAYNRGLAQRRASSVASYLETGPVTVACFFVGPSPSARAVARDL